MSRFQVCISVFLLGLFVVTPLLHATHTHGPTEISGNDALTSLGLTRLASVSFDLRIYENAALVNLDGLSGLSSVGLNLYVYDNASLADIDGLSGLSSLGDYLHIVDNPRLPTCAAEALVARLRSLGWMGDADTGTCP